MFVGQNRILDYINSKGRDTFPHSLILIGDRGCGKHTVVDMISSNLRLQVVNITDNLNFDYIMELQQKPEPYIYIINANDITVKAQNAMLKFVEEPLKNSYIIITAESSNQLLPTVYNRCQVLTFAPYSRHELSNFTNDNMVLNIAKTPGQAIELTSNSNLNGMLELANKMITKIGVANLPNVLTISDKIAFKKDKDKFDIDLFANVLQYSIKEYIVNNSGVDKKYYEYYKLIGEWNRKRKSNSIQQKSLFENYLIKFKNCMM